MIRDQVEDLVLTDKKIRLEKKEELLEGNNPDGSGIGTYSRSPMGQDYAAYKNSLNPRAGYGNVDLILSGNFAAGLFPYQASQGRYLFANRLDYGRELIRRYGQGVVGLNQDTFNKIQRADYAPQIIRYINNQLK